MAIKKTDRDAVIGAALALFRVKGYHHTSIADISQACGLLKGSIYHYFPGKKELAAAALDRVIEDAQEKIFAPAADRSVPPRLRMKEMADAVERYFVGREGGCVMGNLALEVGNAVPEFSARIHRYFDDWAEALAAILEERYGKRRARELAEDSIARVQGAIMMMGLSGDEAVLRRAGRDVIGLLDAPAAGAATKRLSRSKDSPEHAAARTSGKSARGAAREMH